MNESQFNRIFLVGCLGIALLVGMLVIQVTYLGGFEAEIRNLGHQVFMSRQPVQCLPQPSGS